MIETFAGTTMGEWVSATRTLVRYACADAQRAARAISRHERALDPGDDVAAPEEPAGGDRAGFLDWALPQLQGHRRGVLELDRRGCPVEEIMRRLDVSRDVVYQSRRRGLQDLVALREQWP